MSEVTRTFSSTAQLSLVELHSPIPSSCTAHPMPYVVTFATPAAVRLAISLGSRSSILVKQGHNSCPTNCSCATAAVAVTVIAIVIVIVVSGMRVVPQRRNGTDWMVFMSFLLKQENELAAFIFSCARNMSLSVPWCRLSKRISFRTLTPWIGIELQNCTRCFE